MQEICNYDVVTYIFTPTPKYSTFTMPTQLEISDYTQERNSFPIPHYHHQIQDLKVLRTI